jgi:hypothetical protein
MEPGSLAAILILSIVAAMALYVIIKVFINRVKGKDDLDGLL